jgi:hypothetical protein
MSMLLRTLALTITALVTLLIAQAKEEASADVTPGVAECIPLVVLLCRDRTLVLMSWRQSFVLAAAAAACDSKGKLKHLHCHLSQLLHSPCSVPYDGFSNHAHVHVHVPLHGARRVWAMLYRPDALGTVLKLLRHVQCKPLLWPAQRSLTYPKGNVLGSWTNSSSCYCEGWMGISCESGVITNVWANNLGPPALAGDDDLVQARFLNSCACTNEVHDAVLTCMWWHMP